jgi:histidinol phosphatase-like enzyme
MIQPKTIITDIDGTLIRHCGDISKQHLIKVELLPGVKEKLIEWDRGGYNIILITGRRESTRQATEKQLCEAGIFYDHLIMGLKNFNRVLINDRKPDSINDTCFAINLVRNEGIEGIQI